MPKATTRRLVAGLLSAVLPGAGQLYVGARRRGLFLLSVTALLLVTLLVLASTASLQVDRRLVAGVLAADLALFAFRLFAVADAWRGGGAVGLAALTVLVAAPHVAAGYVTVRGYGALEDVFAEEEPGDVLPARGVFLIDSAQDAKLEVDVIPASPPAEPEPDWPEEERPLARSVQVLDDADEAARPWTTILLLGTDEGPGNWGARTDTIILVAIQHGTGRAAAFGIPRNLVQVPVGPKLKRFNEPLNALYGFARTKPGLFRGGADPGATALKQAVSRLLGIRVDYHALVNLRGFADLVDALGGVRIQVRERLVDSVTRPAWGEPKPRIDVRPGEVRRFYGREALAYVRSRKDSSDYARMARQRCFLSALASQLDPVRVLRSFGRLTSIVKSNVSTDVPLDRLPRLVRLATGIDPNETLTVTFGTDYFFGRRKSDNHPVPHGSRMRATVRRAILHPEQLRMAGKAATARASC